MDQKYYLDQKIFVNIVCHYRSDIWFDDVDIEDIEHAIGKKLKCNGNSSEKPKSGQDVNSNANLQLHDHKAR